MSNELESARAIMMGVIEQDPGPSKLALVVNLELLEPMVLVTVRPRPSRQVRRTRSDDHVSGHLDCTIRFLLERGLRFRNLGFCGHDLM